MNKERKQLYISQKEENVSMAGNAKKILFDVEKYEERYEKDVCDWNSKEIIEFYKYLNTQSFQSLVMYNNTLKAYSTWCLINGLSANNQNHFDEINTEILLNCVNKAALKIKTMISRKELIENINTLPNYQDRFIFLGLFEGLEAKEICSVSLSDLDGSVLNCGNRELEISDELIDYITIAATEDEYTSLKGNRTFNLLPMDTIVRPLDPTKLRGSITDPVVLVTTRLRKCSEFLFGYPLKIKDVREAGRLDYIKEMKKGGMSTQECFARPSKHEERFGRIQNISAYIEMYGSYLELQNDEQYGITENRTDVRLPKNKKSA